MSKQVSEFRGVNFGNYRSEVMVRTIYYAVIMGIGLMLAMAVYLAI